ncbi:MAG: NADH:flavin oxidoreductase/NADH oxidase family protein [Deltaproteobacteria bacterium]|nr:NADH:flavin oxidoreductase/NADH oxidase family protein [Deltaproteobacteria bacterium]
MSVLARPLSLRSGLTLPNRIAKAAMSETMATPGGEPSPELEVLYRRLARGGAGLFITGNVMVEPGGAGEPGNVLVRPRKGPPLEAFRRWAAAAASGPGVAFVQLNHAGRQSPRSVNGAPVAPSAVPLRLGGMFVAPRALTGEEISALVGHFAGAARLAQEAGFSGVQLHAAHGYLFSQFLSPLTNLRTDAWGGPLENRMRFLVESLRAVRRAVGPRFAVSVKLNSSDFLRGGFGDEEATVVARTLDQEGVELLEISGGTYERPAMFVAPRDSTREREAHFLDYARQIRGAVGCPLMLTGGLRTPRVIEEVLLEGSADVVGLARPIALEPDLPMQILAGRTRASAATPPSGRLAVLAAATEGGWYHEQLHRMGRGLEPDAKLSRVRTLMSAARTMWRRAEGG